MSDITPPVDGDTADNPDEPFVEVFEPVEIEEELQRSYIDYAMSVIVGRALPESRDGLKPVHRRILFSMWEGGMRAGTPAPQVRCGRGRRDEEVPPAR